MTDRATDARPDLRDSLRRRVGALFVDNFFRTMASAGRLHPLSRPERHGVEILRDIPYDAGGAHDLRLDVYRPTDRAERLPVVLYVHGGGFRILSKDTHWIMGLAFSRRGYLVFNIDYRLGPRHPYPAAIQDCCAALRWVAANAARYGGDLDRVAFAGESAGGNLVTSLAVATSYARPEPWARAAWDTGLSARAVVPACGLLQVSDPGRFARRKSKMSAFVQDRINEVTASYLGRGRAGAPGDLDLDLADPLVVFERGERPERPLPPFFVPVGTRDPLLDDSRRLKSALDRLGATCDVRYYPGEMHAFHALVWRKNARQCWADTFAFLDRHVGGRVEDDRGAERGEAIGA